MRRRFATAVPAALMAVMLIVGSALAGHGHATGGGTFIYAGGLERLDFEAHDYGVGDERDRGTARYRNLINGVQYTAKIICAFVTEDVVKFGYIIPSTASTEGFTPPLVGWEVVWEVRDGGSPGAGNDSAAWVAAPPNGNVIAENCDTTFVPTGGVVLNGNFTVHEASN